MIYIERDTNNLVTFIHYEPGELEDTAQGLLVDEVPEVPSKDGYLTELYYDGNDFTYKYVAHKETEDTHTVEELKQSINILSDALEELMVAFLGGDE